MRFFEMSDQNCFPDWKVSKNEMNVRPPQRQTDDALYIDDDNVTLVKTEEWEGRPKATIEMPEEDNRQ